MNITIASIQSAMQTRKVDPAGFDWLDWLVIDPETDAAAAAATYFGRMAEQHPHLRQLAETAMHDVLAFRALQVQVGRLTIRNAPPAGLDAILRAQS